MPTQLIVEERMHSEHAEQREELERELALVMVEAIATNAAEQVVPSGQQRSGEWDQSPKAGTDEDLDPVAVHHGGSTDAEFAEDGEAAGSISAEAGPGMMHQLLDAVFPPRGASAEGADGSIGLIAL